MVKGARPGDQRLVWDPAGSDRRLSLASQDLRVGRFASARDLLQATGARWDLRCHRLLTLAGAAVDGEGARRWTAEEPNNADAWVLAARIQVAQAQRAHREGHRRAPELVAQARDACLSAAGRWEQDPVPWVALLQLASVDPGEVTPGPVRELADVKGPWALMAQLWGRDLFNREGHHRLLGALGPAAGGTMAAVFDAARWVAGTAPPGSPLHVLPLVASAASFRHQAGDDARKRVLLADRQWATVTARIDIERAHGDWFASAARSEPTVLADLHHLAHAEWQAGMRGPAREVFAEIGPYASTVPWSFHGDAARTLSLARTQCGYDPLAASAPGVR